MGIILTITDWLKAIDRNLFVFVHSTASSESMDGLFRILREPLTWIPLYIFVLYMIVTRYKRYAWQFVVMTLMVFAVTDFTSASVLKPLFSRVRPCFDPELQGVLRNLVPCGGKFGMPSTHASNHFGLASFWFFTLTWMGNRRWYWLWFWALAICYAQVYVGKHFPGDVLVGAALGTLVGSLFAMIFQEWMMRRVANPQ